MHGVQAAHFHGIEIEPVVINVKSASLDSRNPKISPHTDKLVTDIASHGTLTAAR